MAADNRDEGLKIDGVSAQKTSQANHCYILINWPPSFKVDNNFEGILQKNLNQIQTEIIDFMASISLAKFHMGKLSPSDP